ncbi:MAG: aconitate hydratase AcnA [Rickettsiaceae bacterium]
MSKEKNQQYKKSVEFDNKKYWVFDIKQAAKDLNFDIEKLPFSLRVLFENSLRNGASTEDLLAFKEWLDKKTSSSEIDFYPARVLMQDFTGVPAIVDLASMRDAIKVLGTTPHKINPLIPVDLVIDHSVQVDSYGSATSFAQNVEKEVERNLERYQFLKWGQKSFGNFRVVPPGTGICHQVNLEYLAQTVWMNNEQGGDLLYPDTLVGTDSHTTMINALSVLGWGVGGIEAEAAMLGQPLPMILPEVIGFKITGSLKGNITATDLVLTVTEMLRKKGVVGKFVEFFGSGLDNLSLADKATVSNMAPEYGATCGFFPIDGETIRYLEFSGRDLHRVNIVKEYAQNQAFWRNSNDPIYTEVLELDLSKLEPSLAWPKRPQDRVALSKMKTSFKETLPALAGEGASIDNKFNVDLANYKLGHGDVVIAAITSCTNTSNPSVMVAAGLVAEKASKLGLKSQPWVKTSLAPGSQVVTEYLQKSGLDKHLNSMGFNLVGYGCTTCIGNSGPLKSEIEKTITDNHLTVASILSGNRNFEGRIHPLVRANYLASPPLVVAYAIAGTVNIDLDKDSLGNDKNGNPVYLKDIWPSNSEIKSCIDSCITPAMFKSKYSDVFTGDKNWQNIIVKETDTYDWSDASTYIKNPPYFENIDKPAKELNNINNAKILALFGDSITTDHISPAGSISKTSPAAKFLMDKGIAPAGFNSYGARRGNHEIMMRGTFANIRIKNHLCNGVEGGFTINHLNGEQMSIYDAAMEYKNQLVPLVIFAGKEYGTGSSRDWAAKGTSLLGVKAVVAESFERIHRSNLVGMGVLPVSFKDGQKWVDLNLKGDEEISILGITNDIKPYQPLKCLIKRSDAKDETIDVIMQVYTDNEIEYIKHGSILGAVLKNLASS